MTNPCTSMSTSSSSSSCRRILVADRTYSTWSFENVDTDMPADAPLHLPSDFHPATARLFSKDVFQCEPFELLHSPVRKMTTLAGVLQLSDHRTYGRKGKRLLYQCIPDDKYLPAFLIPYEVQIGFSKSPSNKFVVFRYESWSDKHPHGLLVETLGDVTSLEAFYEYQLYSKRLHDSITRLTQDARTSLNRIPIETYISQIQQRYACSTDDDAIFSIDPQNSLDYDDALRIQTLEPDRRWKVSVYIANVVFWLEALDLWNSLTNRVATIYLPDRRRPMLPTVLSDSLCSLQEGEDRFAFVCDMIVTREMGIVETTFRYAHVRVVKNYRYEDASLLALSQYQTLLNLTKHLDVNCKDSHDVVAYWMIETNAQCATHLANHRLGIFRSVAFQPKSTDVVLGHHAEISDNCRRTIQLWSSNTSGQYVLIDDSQAVDDDRLHHDVLKKSVYVHMTSPIRRLVDLLNQLTFLTRIMNVPLSASAEMFLQTWTRKLDFINTSMRSIRKVQNECQLLYRCTHDPSVFDTTHIGVVFDRLERESGYYNYMVYVESLGMVSKVRSTHYHSNYGLVVCQLLLFEIESSRTRKIRVSLLDKSRK